MRVTLHAQRRLLQLLLFLLLLLSLLPLLPLLPLCCAANQTAMLPRSPRPSRGTTQRLRARFGGAAHAEATRASLLALLGRGRAPVPAPAPQPLPPPAATANVDGLLLEHTTVEVEAGGERCPLLLCREASRSGEPLRPVFVMHGTGKSLTDLLEHGHLQRFARRGLLAVGVDARHHGGRVQPGGGNSTAKYWEALITAWRAPEPDADADADADAVTPAAAQHRMPFILDTVHDLMRALDWLEGRADVDCSRVGATGISLGGMMAWYWAAADPRVTSAAPAIGVQGFRWAIAHDAWHARAASLAPLMEAAATDLGRRDRAPDGGVVAAVWAKIAPGVDADLDAPRTLACAAWPALPNGPARPVLVVNSAADPRCPRQGVDEAVAAARDALGPHRDALRVFWDESVAAAPLPAAEWARGHVVTPAMWAQIDRFFEDTVLKGLDAPSYDDEPEPASAATAAAAGGGSTPSTKKPSGPAARLGRRGTVKLLQTGRNLEVGSVV